jgi:hypothetical protein
MVGVRQDARDKTHDEVVAVSVRQREQYPVDFCPAIKGTSMTNSVPVLTPDEALTRVDRLLDLSNIRMKLANPENGEPPSAAQIDLMEGEYRRFLALKLSYPDSEIVPDALVDEMWHRHILDTAAYRADCEVIFGRFIDHFPYFGMRGPEDAEALDDAFAETRRLYMEAFGEPLGEIGEAVRCRTQCKPVRCR